MTKREAGLLAVSLGALLGWKTALKGYNAMERSRDDKWFEAGELRKENERLNKVLDRTSQQAQEAKTV